MQQKYFILIDQYTNDLKFLNFEELKNELLKELIQDAQSNNSLSIIEDNFNICKMMYKNNDLNFIKKNLASYGWNIYELREIIDNLDVIKLLVEKNPDCMLKENIINNLENKIKEIKESGKGEKND